MHAKHGYANGVYSQCAAGEDGNLVTCARDAWHGSHSKSTAQQIKMILVQVYINKWHNY